MKLGRFRSLTRTTQSFCHPQGYTLEKYLGNAWGIQPGDKSYNVQIRFSPLLSPYVAEINWHRTQQVRWEDNGQVILSAKVDGLEEIAWWVHGFGAHVEILAPEALRERVAHLSAPSPSPDRKQPFGLFDI